MEHISPYQLTIEPGTTFHRAVSRGVFSTPEPDLAAELFDTTQSVLGAAGFDSYEVSNHARRPSARALHNLIYWRGHDYIGVGPGAHGRLTLDGERHATAAPQAIRDYINPATNGERAPSLEKMSAREVALERLFMGLRTWEGVALTDLAPLEITADRLNDLAGSVVVSGGRLFTTNNGRLVLDRIVAMLADSA